MTVNHAAMAHMYRKLMVEPLKANLEDLADSMSQAEDIWQEHVAAGMPFVAGKPCQGSTCPACRMAAALGMTPNPSHPARV